MPDPVVITGIGMVTPLGKEPREILRRIEAGESAAAASGFNPDAFACPLCARVTGFQAQPYVSEVKLVRLMNRDAQLAVAAARLALQDARLTVGADYRPEEVALFGAAGMAGVPLAEVLPLLNASTAEDGSFDLRRFGETGLRAVSPVLSFKILSNMPICFVSICENIQGANAIYTPWEGHGAQAIEAGVRALESGEAPCALVGGCDAKTHELAFLALEQQGLFGSWQTDAASAPDRIKGVVPGEGAAFLVLETETNAIDRRARIFARLRDSCSRSRVRGGGRAETFRRVLTALTKPERNSHGQVNGATRFDAIVAAGNGDPDAEADETAALAALDIATPTSLCPKKHVGDLFAAAAPVQVGLAALLAERGHGRVLANCFGHGSEHAAFVLERP